MAGNSQTPRINVSAPVSNECAPVLDLRPLATIAQTSPVTANNVGTVRKLNSVLFPVKYSEPFYKTILLPELEEYCKLSTTCPCKSSSLHRSLALYHSLFQRHPRRDDVLSS